MDDALRKLETQLKQSGKSITRPRRVVFAVLFNAAGPISVSELVALSQVDRASVYRVIALFEELTIVRRVQIGWKYKLELTDIFLEHHHHMICVQCGMIRSFEETPSIEFEIKQLAMEAGFSAISHELEISGLCEHCSKK